MELDEPPFPIEAKFNPLEAEVKKKIEIRFNYKAFFAYPKVKRIKYKSIQQYMEDSDWAKDLKELNECLHLAFIPIWLWIIIIIFSGGLLGFIIIPWQISKTKKAAEKLRKFVEKRNERFLQLNWPIQYEIPLPSKDGVIINVCILSSNIYKKAK